MHLTNFCFRTYFDLNDCNILYITLAPEEVTCWKEQLAFIGNL